MYTNLITHVVKIEVLESFDLLSKRFGGNMFFELKKHLLILRVIFVNLGDSVVVVVVGTEAEEVWIVHKPPVSATEVGLKVPM